MRHPHVVRLLLPALVLLAGCSAADPPTASPEPETHGDRAASSSAASTAASPPPTTARPSARPGRSAGPRNAKPRRGALAPRQRVVEGVTLSPKPTPEPAADNPLDRPWGVYTGPQDQVWGPYQASSGATRDLLSYIALAPRTKWMGAWVSDSQIEASMRSYVGSSQAGDPSKLVQVAIFRMVPWEHAACSRLPSAAEAASYRRWTDAAARGIGDAHTAVILQPDGPFALCAPGGSRVPSDLIAYSARVYSALPNTSVYIEAGSADWPHPAQGGVGAAADILQRAGVASARGFALNGTHYSSTVDEVRRGADIVAELARRGIPGKRFVVNTSSNGNPFEFGTYTGPDPDNAFVCPSRTPAAGSTCVTLGIPPTTDVDSPRWGLPESTRALARQYVDAYMWFGRPWLYRQNDPFQMDRALALVRSTPFR